MNQNLFSSYLLKLKLLTIIFSILNFPEILFKILNEFRTEITRSHCTALPFSYCFCFMVKWFCIPDSWHLWMIYIFVVFEWFFTVSVLVHQTMIFWKSLNRNILKNCRYLFWDTTKDKFDCKNAYFRFKIALFYEVMVSQRYVDYSNGYIAEKLWYASKGYVHLNQLRCSFMSKKIYLKIVPVQ
jgi:hypothetical protein